MNTRSQGNIYIEKPVLDQSRQKKAREYSRLRRRLGFVENGLLLVLLLSILISGASAWFTSLLSWPSPVTAMIYFVTLSVALGLLTFPLTYYRGFILSHRYGISIQKFGSWLSDLGKGAIISLFFGAIATGVVYWLLGAFPGFWWLLAWGIMTMVSVIMTIISPIFLVPLFYKVRPLENTELKERLKNLARKAHTHVQDIFTLDFSRKTTAANAGLMGMGHTRRIVISDTLIQQYSLSEIEVVTAHEIGHHVNKDIFRLFVIQSAIWLIVFWIVGSIFGIAVTSFGLTDKTDPATIPLLLLLVGVTSALASPLINTYSRHVESQADEYALELTDNPDAFVDAMTRLINC